MGYRCCSSELEPLILQEAVKIHAAYVQVFARIRYIRGIGLPCLLGNYDPVAYLRGSWDEFLKIHVKTLWACDFLSKKVWTKFSRVDLCVLFFIHLESRRVFATPVTAHLNDAWGRQQAKQFIMHVEDQGDKVEHVLHDYDTKFTASFDAIMETEGTVIHRVGPQKPNLNTYIERFIQTIQIECLDHFVVLGEKHLTYLVNEYVDFYSTQRPHQAKENLSLTSGPPESGVPGEVSWLRSIQRLVAHQ